MYKTATGLTQTDSSKCSYKELISKPSFGRGVLSYFVDKMYNQKQIADRIGCSQPTVSALLRKYKLLTFKQKAAVYRKWVRAEIKRRAKSKKK